MLQAERCFSHLSVTFHFVWLRLENHSTEIEKSFGAELFTALRNERKLKDGLLIFHSILYNKQLICDLKDERAFQKNSWGGEAIKILFCNMGKMNYIR